MTGHHNDEIQRHAAERDEIVYQKTAEEPARNWLTRLIGRPLPSHLLSHERIGKAVGLAVFSSDALSSTAYATQEILVILAAAGAIGMSFAFPIALAIVVLLLIVAFSYRQTIFAYPGGGGAYTVTKDNLGDLPARAAGSALLTDYVLTVAVSVSAGVAQIVSAFPQLDPFRVHLAILMVVLVMLINLRGARESGVIFAVPTYFFLLMIVLTVSVGMYRLMSGDLGAVLDPPALEHVAITGGLGLFLILRAFANGTTALTGIEAISNGIMAFKEPRSKNAATTLGWMAFLLSTLFLGITYLAVFVGAVPSEAETVISQLARTVYNSRGLLYLGTITSTTVILVMAANTAFADFPRLSALVAADKLLPRQLTFLGSRLVFSRGIVTLAVVSSLLIIGFDARVTALIPLYAVGVFLSFTLSQSGMARHWWRSGRNAPGTSGDVTSVYGSHIDFDAGWKFKLVINAFGAVCTFVVMVIFAVTKFADGAWIVLVIIPSVMLFFAAIKRHYVHIAQDLTMDHYQPLPEVKRHRVIMPINGVHRGTLSALRFAKSIGEEITCVHVAVDAVAAEKLLLKWQQWGEGTKLEIIGSPYRELLTPLLDYITNAAEDCGPDEAITVVMPEFVAHKWWHNLLHTQTAEMLRLRLLFSPGVVIVQVPYQVD